MIDPSKWTKWDPSRELSAPLRWRKARHVVVKGDPFDGSRSNEAIAAVFGVMAASPMHTFQVATSNPVRMREWFEWARPGAIDRVACIAADALLHLPRAMRAQYFAPGRGAKTWPLPNVWLGVSVDCQAHADARIIYLLETPAAVRFVSAEPLLGPIDFTWLDWLTPWLPKDRKPTPYDPTVRLNALTGNIIGPDDMLDAKLDWVIVGGETGRDARPCDVEWIRNIVRQCKAAKVPVFVKQIGSTPHIGDGSAGMSHYLTGDRESCWAMEDESTIPITVYEIRDRDGADPDEWPVDIRVREWPEVRP